MMTSLSYLLYSYMHFNSYNIESDVIAGYTLPIIIYFGFAQYLETTAHTHT